MRRIRGTRAAVCDQQVHVSKLVPVLALHRGKVPRAFSRIPIQMAAFVDIHIVAVVEGILISHQRYSPRVSTTNV